MLEASKKQDDSAIAAIYAAYPRKVGKAEALKAIARTLKAGAITADALLAKVQAYTTATTQWPEADRRFIPHPATWINRGSFDDDPAAWIRNTPTNAQHRSSPGFRHTNIASSDYRGVSD